MVGLGVNVSDRTRLALKRCCTGREKKSFGADELCRMNLNLLFVLCNRLPHQVASFARRHATAICSTDLLPLVCIFFWKRTSRERVRTVQLCGTCNPTVLDMGSSVTGSNADLWHDRFCELIRWKEHYNHCRVPKTAGALGR